MIKILSLIAGLALVTSGVDSTSSNSWGSVALRQESVGRLDKLVARYQLNMARYDRVQRLRQNGMPAPVIFGIHYREADNSFAGHLANGDPLIHRTIHVPRGRLPNTPPPYTWEQGAEDALYNGADHEDRVNWASLPTSLHAIEAYNGLGYARKGLPSPYVWSGTNKYTRGKYVADGRYDNMAIDRQLGVAAILIRLRDRGVPIPWP